MERNNKLPFGKRNYQIMLVGLLVLVLGFVLMSMDSTPHGFGFLGLTLGPLVVFSGFIIELFAILYNPKK